LGWGDPLPKDFRFTPFVGGSEITAESCAGKSTVIIFVSHAQNDAYIRRTLEAADTIARKFSDAKVIAVYVPWERHSLNEAYGGSLPSFSMPVCQLSADDWDKTWHMTGTPQMIIADPKGIIRKNQVGWSGGDATDASLYTNVATPYLNDFANGLFVPDKSLAVKKWAQLANLFGKYTGSMEHEGKTIKNIEISRCEEKDHLLLFLGVTKDRGLIMRFSCYFHEHNPSYYSSSAYLSGKSWGVQSLDEDWKPESYMELSLTENGKRLRIEIERDGAVFERHIFDLTSGKLEVSIFGNTIEPPFEGSTGTFKREAPSPPLKAKSKAAPKKKKPAPKKRKKGGKSG
jgi:hypothetical protein